MTNRSRSTDKNGKWWQLMRSNYIRSFYLPEHHPLPSYTSHFKSRKLPNCDLPRFCDCGSTKDDVNHTQCKFCCECTIAVTCTQEQMLLPDVVAVLKPCVCSVCNKQFADKAGLKVHQDTMHGSQSSTLINPQQSLRSLSVDQLKCLLREKGLSVSWQEKYSVDTPGK